MEVTQLAGSQSAQAAILRFVNHPDFAAIKDAFVAHTPAGDDKIESTIGVCHGKNLGTRFVFNELERIARIPPPQKGKEHAPSQQTGRPDPDLQ